MSNLSSPHAKYLAWGTRTIMVFLFIAVFPVQAVNPLDVVINEVAWMGTEVEGIESKNWWRYEWLELYNNTNQLISLDGWKVELYRSDLDWSLELKGNISAQGYLLIVASDKIFPNYDLNYSNLGGKLNNNGQRVVLKNAIGTIIDEIDCSSGWFAGDNSTKQTMERKNPLLISDLDNWGTSLNPGGTPKTENIEQKPAEDSPPAAEGLSEIGSPETESPQIEAISYPTGVVFSEILPSPEGPDEKEEWIEIFNQNNFEVDLYGWRVADTAGAAKTYAFSEKTLIGLQGYLVVSRPVSKMTLNNDGDAIKIIQPNGKMVDFVEYKNAPRGESYNLTETGWFWSKNLTPGATNVIASQISGEATINLEEKYSKKESNSDIKIEKGLAAVSEPIEKAEISKSFLVFLVATSTAIFSGVIIFFLKKSVQGVDLL